MSNKVYEIVTSKIIQGLEKGYIPWRKPWNGGSPRNYISGKQYHGINTLLLSMNDHLSPYYLTKKQVLDKGGRIHKEQFKNSNIVTYWNMCEVDDKHTGDKIMVPFMRFYEVWNIEQTTLPVPVFEIKTNDRLEAAENILTNMPNKPKIGLSLDRACYSQTMDTIKLPHIDKFVSSDHYYATLFHELGHSTGHPSRLKRDMTGHFGDAKYSFEELVAELTACFICSTIGISNAQLDENAQAYINGWSKFIKRDAKKVIQAASLAKKAADYILDVKHMELEAAA